MACFGRRFTQDIVNHIMGMRDWKAEMNARRAVAKQKKKDDNNFLMDLENYCLGKWDSRQGIPQGPTRVDNPAWREFMKSEILDSDTTWEIYEAWVREGNGDEWFFEEG